MKKHMVVKVGKRTIEADVWYIPGEIDFDSEPVARDGQEISEIEAEKFLDEASKRLRKG